jgi:hypothetical protein
MAQDFSKTVGSEIPPDTAREWIKLYQEKYPDSIRCCFFGSDILHRILKQGDCTGIKIYNAISDEEKEVFVLVGAKETGRNIWPSEGPDSEPEGIVGEQGTYCPPNCE